MARKISLLSKITGVVFLFLIFHIALVLYHARLLRGLANDFRFTTVKKILVLNLYHEDRIVKAKTGGPLGEELLFRTILQVLALFKNCAVFKAFTDETIRKHLSDPTFDFIFTDQYSIDFLRESPIYSTRKCAWRLLDFWGTPEKQNHDRLNLKQYYTPYDYKYNFFMGIAINPIDPSFFPKWKTNSKERIDNSTLQILIHGKDAKYIQPRNIMLYKMIRERYPHIKIVVTLPREALNPELVDIVQNVGILNSTAWHNELAKSFLVIGQGHPVMAPTVLEAIAAGNVYLNFRYANIIILDQNSETLQLSSQNPQAKDMFGEKYVRDYTTDDLDEAMAVIDDVVRNIRRAKPFIHHEYRLDSIAARVFHNLNELDCS